MKKLLLVLPRHEKGYWGHLSRSGKAGMARLSLTVIASLTPSDWEVTIHDARVNPIDFNKKFDLVGITAFTAEAPAAYEIADRFRDRGVPVVMGGFHVSALPEEALRHADSVVVGEAEPVWRQLLEDLGNKRLKSIYKGNKPSDMTGMAVPARHLLDRNVYSTGFYTVQATRGCPHDCEYCAVSAFFGRKYRVRPVAEVVDEIRRFDTRNFFFVDDNITGRKAYAKELFRALAPLRMAWGGQTDINIADDAGLLDLYARGGGRYAFIGFESLSEANLKRMNKSWNSPDRYRQAVRRIQKTGVSVLGSFIFGLDDDDPGVFDRTIDFVKSSGIDAAQFHILTPLPGTRLYRDMDAAGRIVDRDWSNYHTGQVVFKPAGMTAEELQQGYWRAFRKIYAMPHTLKRSFRRFRGLKYRVALNLGYRKKALLMPDTA
ncbi:MAG: radical SAM protein [Thermodesulfobacteriota bacterium]